MSFLTLDVSQIIDMGCLLTKQNHITSLYLSTTLPGALVCFIACVYYVSKAVLHHNKIIELDSHLRVFVNTLQLGILFMIYPTVSATILRTFTCEQLDDGSNCLVYDPSVDCDSVDYANAKICALYFPFTAFSVADL